MVVVRRRDLARSTHRRAQRGVRHRSGDRPRRRAAARAHTRTGGPARRRRVRTTGVRRAGPPRRAAVRHRGTPVRARRPRRSDGQLAIAARPAARTRELEPVVWVLRAHRRRPRGRRPRPARGRHRPRVDRVGIDRRQPSGARRHRPRLPGPPARRLRPVRRTRHADRVCRRGRRNDRFRARGRRGRGSRVGPRRWSNRRDHLDHRARRARCGGRTPRATAPAARTDGRRALRRAPRRRHTRARRRAPRALRRPPRMAGDRRPARRARRAPRSDAFRRPRARTPAGRYESPFRRARDPPPRAQGTCGRAHRLPRPRATILRRCRRPRRRAPVRRGDRAAHGRGRSGALPRTAAELHGALRQGRLRRHDRRTRDRRPPHVRRRSVRSRHRRARSVRRGRDDRHRRSHDPGAERRGPLPPRVLSHRAHQPPYHRVARCRADRRRHGSRRRCNARDRPQVARPGGRAARPRADARAFARRAHRSALLVGGAIPARSLRGDSTPVVRERAQQLRGTDGDRRLGAARCCVRASRTAPRCSCPTAATSPNAKAPTFGVGFGRGASRVRLGALRDRRLPRARLRVLGECDRPGAAGRRGPRVRRVPRIGRRHHAVHTARARHRHDEDRGVPERRTADHDERRSARARVPHLADQPARRRGVGCAAAPARGGRVPRRPGRAPPCAFGRRQVDAGGGARRRRVRVLDGRRVCHRRERLVCRPLSQAHRDRCGRGAQAVRPTRRAGDHRCAQSLRR